MANGDAPNGIKPTRFRPTEQTTGLRLPLPNWWQWLFVAFAIFVAIVAWFLYAATAVRVTTNVEDAQVSLSGAIAIPSGPSFLILPGIVNVRAEAKGYETSRQQIRVLNQPDQVIALELLPLPGIVSITGTPPEALVFMNGDTLGLSPLTVDIPAGEVELEIEAPRYQPTTVTATILGREVEQTLAYELVPNWATVTLPTTPSAAMVQIDDEATSFTTPGPIELLAGERKLSVKAPGYERWTDILFVAAGEEIELEPVELRLIGATLNVRSTPLNASVAIDGQFIGTTPIETDIRPNRNHRVRVTLFGYQAAERTINLQTGQASTLSLDLKPITGQVVVTTQPPNVEIFVDGEYVGKSDTVLTLPIKEHEFSLRKNGFAGYTTNLTAQADFPQELKVRLLTDEEARIVALEQAGETVEGQTMILLEPYQITLGASRRQPGRRANEVFRSVELDRRFFISQNEVTNGEFRRFAQGHDSGEFENQTLNKDEQPVVKVSWWEAAQYCNWLSQKEGFDPFYILRPGDPASYDVNSLGYRLPTEAEWSWTARTRAKSDDLLLFPWGSQLPPQNYHGNYADRSAQHLIGRTIFNYNDNHTVAAPVGTFDANYHGVYDLGGNVAEWTHNFYEVPSVNATVSNLGPETGDYHVIKGSGWKDGTITDLRFSYREYATDGRQDVGFRLARFAE